MGLTMRFRDFTIFEQSRALILYYFAYNFIRDLWIDIFASVWREYVFFE